MRTRYGPGVGIPTTDGAEIEPFAGSNPNFAAWEQNEPYTIALLIRGRSGGASTKHLYRSGVSSTDDHILWLASGVTPNLRHDSNTGTVTITSSVSVTNDTAWHTLVATWRPRRLELYVDGISRAYSTAAETNTSDAFGIYRWGWGFSTTRTSTATSRSSRASPHPGPPPWCGAGTPIRSASCAHGTSACAHGERATRHAPLDRHGRSHLPDGVMASSWP